MTAGRAAQAAFLVPIVPVADDEAEGCVDHHAGSLS